MALSKQTNKKQCMNSKKRLFSWYYLRLFFSVLIVLPLALIILVTRRSLRLIETIFLRRPMVREPIRTIRLEDMETEDFEEEEKKTQEWLKNFDDPLILSNARYIAEYNYHLPNKQNNEQNDLTKFPEIPYDDPLR